MGFAIAIAQPLDHVAVTCAGTSAAILDRVEVGNERNRDPIVAVDSLIAGDDRAHLARLAAAQLDRGFGADALEIDGVVPGGIQGAEEAIRLLHQQGRLRTAARATKDSPR